MTSEVRYQTRITDLDRMMDNIDNRIYSKVSDSEYLEFQKRLQQLKNDIEDSICNFSLKDY